MRNLRNIRHAVWTPPTTDQGLPPSASCWDPAKDHVLCTFGPSDKEATIRLVRLEEHVRASSVDVVYRQVASWQAPSPNPDLAVDRVLSLHHFSDGRTTCLVLEGGDITVVQESEDSQNGVHIEIVGSIDEGITAASWSPDEELLFLSTKANTVVLMSRSFDGIADATMTAEDVKLSKQVSVGWGNKATQFQGKGAKAMRDPTIPERVDKGTLSPQDDGLATVSWRGDGAYVAVNSIEPGIRRLIRVYSRDGALDSVSEAVDGMEGALSWRPAGNLLAGVKRQDDKVEIIFFERNGLRHGQFPLRSSSGLDLSKSQIRLEWNSDSTVLAIVLDDRIQLWTMGNYHWYLKQEVFTGEGPTVLRWHPEKALRLAIAAGSKLVLAEYILSIARGSLVPPNDDGAVAVIDGQSLKITPFRTANVPPPMALYDVDASSAIVDVAFSPDNNYMAALHQKGADLYRWQRKGERALQPGLETSFTLPEPVSGSPLVPLQVAVDSDGSIQVLCFESTLEVLCYSHDSSLAEVSSPTRQNAGPVFGFVASDLPDSGIAAQDCLGRFHAFKGGQDHLLPVRVPCQLPWTHAVSSENGPMALGLSRNGHLYANSRLLVKNCTSFLTTPDHLIFTTTTHLLKFVHMTTVEALELPPDDPEADERCRSLERGARLVTAMPRSMSLVLQMPRGNLETIYPRAMVVAGIRRLIDEEDYGRAFSHCRTQRVDMNLLYDHNPQQFLDNVTTVLEQWKDVTYIDLFLSSIRDEDVSRTMYRDTRPSRSQPPTLQRGQGGMPSDPVGTSSKTNTICDAVLASLQSRKRLDNETLQNIITANVCKVPPALEDGLLVVARLMEEDDQLAEAAVEHICFLADVNTLYDEALGLYNLHLALLVAQQSQRDPREYMPFVQDLHRLPELRRHFTIDHHLGRHAKALAHLQALNAHQEAQDYTVKHELYSTALKLYRYDEANLTVVTRLYAAYLESKSRYREAGLTNECLHDYASATRCYVAAGARCWREALYTAQVQVPTMSAAAFSDLAHALADALVEAKDYAAAAAIHADHLSSLPTAIQYLCKGNHFGDALRLVAAHDRADLLESAVDVGLADALGSSTEFLAECRSQLLAQVPRILELRRRAAEDPLAFHEGDRAGGADLPDDVSVAASSRISTGATSSSLFTRYTGRGASGSVGTVGTGVSRASSKNRKRQERKRARGRKGTVYEEEYLVNSVRRLVDRVQAAKAEIERLVFGLVRRGMAERARTLEAFMVEVLAACAKAVDDVFSLTTAGAGAGAGADKTGLVGGDRKAEDGAAEGRDEPTAEGTSRARTAVRPVVTGLEKLSLLGG